MRGDLGCAEMVQFVCDKPGWDSKRLRRFPYRVEHPVYGHQVIMIFRPAALETSSYKLGHLDRVEPGRSRGIGSGNCCPRPKRQRRFTAGRPRGCSITTETTSAPRSVLHLGYGGAKIAKTQLTNWVASTRGLW